MTGPAGSARRHLLVNGIVQGVGFRPFVFNLAERHRLTGFVTNTSEGVVVEVQGTPADLTRFGVGLREEAPPLADIISVVTSEIPAVEGEGAFVIRPSQNSPGTSTLIPPDVAVCEDCRREVNDPADRRHGYPFTNCTNCGPRWTIIDRIPYDRPYTSMASFTMCALCRAEYDDPRNRRFHAQPNACPECGPRIELRDPQGELLDGPPLDGTVQRLVDGRILAIKGLGGFHLAVRADDEAAVIRLRRRKGREAKPLAVMVRDLDAARQLALVGDEEAEQLTSPVAPIVLLERRADAALAPAVCGAQRRVGIMLAYTPLHVLLLERLAARGVQALVMTSGNASEEPICIDNQQALERLGPIADALLLHDRDILRRADDSVLQVIPCGPLVFRRGRGLAPVPVHLDADLHPGPPVLAVGPELKNTVCLLKEDRAFLSPHIGDLENLEANSFFRESVDKLQAVLECRPTVIAHDLHPGYFSTQHARGLGDVRLVGVQHHHAHLAAVLAEQHLDEPVVGLIMDGAGYGTDGTIWGGEILIGDARSFRRFAHLQTVPLPGGDAAVRAPWRMAVSHLRQAFGSDPADWPDLPWLQDHPVSQVLEMLERKVNSPLTSSCGRLFDAVAALTGRWPEVHHEAQAASEFMALTDMAQVREAEPLAQPELRASGDGQPRVLATSPLVRAVARAVACGEDAAVISARFHRTLIDMLCHAALAAAQESGLNNVVLGGGVLQNEIMMMGLMSGLPDFDLQPWRSVQLSPNDGAVALGQAVVARGQVQGNWGHILWGPRQAGLR